MLKGYEYFTYLPGVIEEMTCKVCHSVCNVKRDVLGCTSWASSMAKKKTLHDEFRCPYVDGEWHKQALKLVKDIEKCSSPSIKKIMQDDLKVIIEKKESQNEIK